MDFYIPFHHQQNENYYISCPATTVYSLKEILIFIVMNTVVSIEMKPTVNEHDTNGDVQ